jgi:hypothetical protein
MKAIKKAVVLRYEPVIEDHIVATLEGPVPTRVGEVILTGTRGERWPMSRERFERTYEIAGEGACWKKPVVVEVQRKEEPFQVTVSWSQTPIHGKPGDWFVTYGPNDFGVVDASIFDETYDIID